MMNEKGNKMMNQYAVYQLPEDSPYIRDMYFMKSDEIEKISDGYELVARIDARSLDQVFRIGNFVCPEDDTLRQVFGSMRSISVGDIIHNLDTDETFVVAKYGFDPITMKEDVL
jgi:hypothetical protein